MKINCDIDISVKIECNYWPENHPEKFECTAAYMTQEKADCPTPCRYCATTLIRGISRDQTKSIGYWF